MTVDVLFFSQLQDVVGGERLSREVPAGATVADLLADLYREWPTLREWDGSLLVAVALSYAGRDHVLAEGDEVAVMPPVQGG